MQPFRPPSIPSSDPLRFSQATTQQRSPLYYPQQGPSSVLNGQHPIDIRPHRQPSSNFIKSKEQQQKAVPNGVSQSGVPFWTSNQRSYINNYHGTQSSPHPNAAEGRMYSISNPAEEQRRGSQDIGFEARGDLKGPERSSQSIFGIRERITRQAASSKQYSNYRPLLDYATAQEGRKRSPSPYSQHFNAQQYTIKTRPDSNHLSQRKDERDSVVSLTKRNEPADSRTYNSYVTPKDHGFKSPFQELRPQVTSGFNNNENRSQNQDGQPSNRQYQEEHDKDLTRKKSNKDLFEKHSHSRTNSGLERDIEALRNAKKQTDSVISRENSSNPYLSQTLKSDDGRQSSDWQSERSEMEQKLLTILQKEVDEKTRELAEKNKEIWDKSKIIIEKNKNIDFLSCEVREFKRKIQQHGEVLSSKQQEYEQILTLQSQEIEGLKEKLSQAGSAVKEQELKQKEKAVADKQGQINQLREQLRQLKKRVDRLNNQNRQIVRKTQQLQQTQSKKEAEIIQLKSSSLTKQKQVMDTHDTLASLKKQLQISRQQTIKKEEQIIVLQQKMKKQNKQYEDSRERMEVTRLQQKQAMVLTIKNLEESIKHLKGIQDKQQETQQVLTHNQEAVANGDSKEKQVKKQAGDQMTLLKNKILEMEQQQKEIGDYLMKKRQYEHEKIVSKLKQLVQASQAAQNMRLKELQRVEDHRMMKHHQEFLDKKCHDMSRQLKRTGNKLLGMTAETIQSMKLIFETNQEVVISDLRRLDSKYKDLAEADQQQCDKQ